MESKSKTRVLIGFIGNSRGGLSQYIINLYKKINKSNIEFEFISIGEDVFYREELEQLGAKIHVVTPKRKNAKKYKSDLENILSKSFDCVYIHKSTLSNIDIFLIAKRLQIKKIIIHSHSSKVEGNFITQILHSINKLRINKCVTDMIACSIESGKYMFGKNPYKVINNGIDLEKYYYDNQIRTEIRKKLKLQNKTVIGHVGRFVDVKNHEYLIDLFKHMKEKDENLFLVLCGDGELKNKIQKMVLDLNLINDVMFIGDTNEINEFLNCFDIFILPSKFEGAPLVLIESIATGLRSFISNTITNEVMISELIKKIDIKENIDFTADKILLNIKEIVYRKSQNELLKENGYDINDTLIEISNILTKEI